MLEWIFHLLTGCVRFRVEGDAARFFTIAAKSGLGLWGFFREGEISAAWIQAKEYKKLRAVRRRCGGRTRVLCRRGLPFQAARLWRRKGLALGALGGVALYAFLSSFVWNISVSGAETIQETELLRAAEERGVYVGSRRADFSPRAVANGILNEVDGLTWISVNTDGCFVEIAVKESQEKPEISDDRKLCSIVAAREGKIVAIEANHGRPEVQLGDTVEEGQLLISGIFTQEVDPYGPQPQNPMVTYGAARGSVTAETYREFTVQVSSRLRREVSNGKRTDYTLQLFWLRVPLGIYSPPEGPCRVSKGRESLHALDVELPAALEWKTYEFLGEEERTLSEEEMEEQALLKLRETQKAVIAPGGKVVQEELQYTFAEGVCILNAKCRCEEEIGKIQEILVE